MPQRMRYEGEPGNDISVCLTLEEDEDGVIPQETSPAGRSCGLRLSQDHCS